jgi:hypothetical protein
MATPEGSITRSPSKGLPVQPKAVRSNSVVAVIERKHMVPCRRSRTPSRSSLVTQAGAIASRMMMSMEQALIRPAAQIAPIALCHETRHTVLGSQDNLGVGTGLEEFAPILKRAAFGKIDRRVLAQRFHAGPPAHP